MYEVIEDEVVVAEPLQNKINSALEKENLTELTLRNLKDMYFNITINGVDDLDSQSVAKEGKSICVKLRTGTILACKKGREDAIKEQKLWLAKEKEIVLKISEVESHLDSELDRIEKVRREIKAKEYEQFVTQFKAFGKHVTAMQLVDKSKNSILNDLQNAKAEFEEKQRIQLQKEENERRERELAEKEARLQAEAKLKALEEAKLKEENERRERELAEREAKLKALEEYEAQQAKQYAERVTEAANKIKEAEAKLKEENERRERELAERERIQAEEHEILKLQIREREARLKIFEEEQARLLKIEEETKTLADHVSLNVSLETGEIKDSENDAVVTLFHDIPKSKSTDFDEAYIMEKINSLSSTKFMIPNKKMEIFKMVIEILNHYKNN